MNSPYYMTLGVYGDQALYPVFEPDTLEHYRLVERINREMTSEERRSVALGYCFDPSEVSVEYAAVSAVIAQYAAAIACGAVNPETQVPAFVRALEEAGIDRVIAANQAQLDAWKARQ